MKLRSAGLALALAATLVAAYLAPGADGAVVAPTARQAAPAQRPSATPRAPAERETQPATVLRIRSREDVPERTVHGGFAAATWAAPPPTPVPLPPRAAASVPMPPPAAPAPVAPPLPFRVLGRYLGEGAPAVFLQHNDQNLVVRMGDMIAGQYKVENIDEANVTLLHMSTQQKQTLAMGAPP